MQLAIADSAFNDLADIQSYYRQQGVGHIGDKFVSEIIARLEVLVEHPEIGRIVPEFAEPNFRELIHPVSSRLLAGCRNHQRYQGLA